MIYWLLIRPLELIRALVSGLWFLARHPLMFERFMRTYRELAPQLEVIEQTKELRALEARFRSLPRAQRRMIERRAGKSAEFKIKKEASK